MYTLTQFVQEVEKSWHDNDDDDDDVDDNDSNLNNWDFYKNNKWHVTNSSKYEFELYQWAFLIM